LDIITPHTGGIRILTGSSAGVAGMGLIIGAAAARAVDPGYHGIKTTAHGANDFMLLSNGSDTLLSAKDASSVYIVGGGYNTNNMITVYDPDVTSRIDFTLAAGTGTAAFNGHVSGNATLQAVGATTLGSTLAVSGSTTLAGALSSSAAAVFVQSISSSGDLAVTGNVHGTIFYGSAAGLTGISSDAVDVTSSTANINYPIVFTEGFQADGTLGLGGNSSLTYNPSAPTPMLSSSVGLQFVGAAILGNTLKVSGSTTFAAGITHNRTAITATTYTILVTDYYIGVDTSSNAVTLTLPVAATAGDGKTYIIKDEGANASSNNITVQGDGSETIDGDASQVMTSPYGSIGVYSDGSNWFVY